MLRYTLCAVVEMLTFTQEAEKSCESHDSHLQLTVMHWVMIALASFDPA